MGVKCWMLGTRGSAELLNGRARPFVRKANAVIGKSPAPPHVIDGSACRGELRDAEFESRIGYSDPRAHVTGHDVRTTDDESRNITDRS